MIVGKEGILVGGGFRFNDLLPGTFPRAKFDVITGLRSKPDFNPVNDAATGRTGEIARDATLAGRSITYEGRLQAKNVFDLRTIQADFGAALVGVGEKAWVAKPHEDYAGDAELPERHFHARVVSADPGDDPGDTLRDPETGGYMSPFSMVIRMSDPRYYFPDEDVQTDDTRAADGSGTGEAIDPGGGLSTAAQQLQVTCNNEGNFDTEMELYLEGPCENPILSNETTGKFLRFRDLVLDAGESITYDSRRRRITRNSGATQRHKVDPASTWWDNDEVALDSGSNIIRARGFSLGAASVLTVTFTSADIS